MKSNVGFSNGAHADFGVHAVADCRVGDFYRDDGREGVVFEVDASGCHGKIVALQECRLPWRSCGEAPAVGACDRADGRRNMSAAAGCPDDAYPAFAWCAGLGDGWYLPAIGEVERLVLDDSVRETVNRTLRRHGGAPLVEKGDDEWYWSSSEDADPWCAWLADVYECRTYAVDKSNPNCVRAIAVF